MSLIKNLAFVFRFFDLHTTSPYLFQQDAVIMLNGWKFPNFRFPNFLNKFRKPNVVTFRKANELLSIEKLNCESRQWAIKMGLNTFNSELSQYVSETTGILFIRA